MVEIKGNVDPRALGPRLRDIRRAKGLTVQDLARRSGVSRSMVSEVERGGRVPTILTLDRLATALGTGLGRLVAGEAGDDDAIIVRRQDEQARLDEGSWSRTVLNPNLAGVEFEFMRVEIAAGVDAGAYDPHMRGSREYVAVESGVLTLSLDGRDYRLAAGDSIYFGGARVHAFRNDASVPCTYYLVMDAIGPDRAHEPRAGAVVQGADPVPAPGAVPSEREPGAGTIVCRADPAVPGWDWTPEAERALLSRAAELASRVLADTVTGPVTGSLPEHLLTTFATSPVPVAGSDVRSVLADIAEQVMPYPFGNGHPMFFAWVNSPAHPMGVAANAIATALNPSMAGGRHAGVHLEHEVIRWFCELLGWETAGSAAGQLVSGGSAATLTALGAARHRAAAAIGLDDRVDGVAGLAPRIYATAQAHSCLDKAVEALGLGRSCIARVPHDAADRMLPEHLARMLEADIAAGLTPVAVVASVGTVNTGAIDPLDQIARIARAHDVWLHVDGAYGGPAALLLDDLDGVKAGMAQADSLALDPHKWLYAPVDCGMVLFKDGSWARDAYSLVPPYLRSQATTDEPVWFSEYGLEQTRPFRALKLWAQLQLTGLDGYRSLIGHDLAVASALRELLVAAPDFQVFGHGLSIVCFRYTPAGVAEEDLDALNADLALRVQRSGRAFIAQTTVVAAGRSVTALRACIVNPNTTEEHAAALLQVLREV
ncbi:pyridoxal-dependent decarboxylase [Brevibacterium sp. 50QC2O2]|uniref:pyridoxal-dependent decarboxylase n=1 Tax=Brevibacterium TaxID=1696 RepID=UPI00211C5B6B|nr:MULTISPECIES: pyridoxal-dependent decarboxylase [unclassified Brevibacterium]MCQ9367702.1 pyridoxal-dependent decarboxylase [Brevibacterium sp. 91QC2O2]MCQ9384992.1 pyridoxal-dependent decarboxylase [Brevibacterium sp. 68QC2CO]MCQ9387961.1 pyridoxal-dependent decarboxylase [Brevibacterium sp. 50QC2O2]